MQKKKIKIELEEWEIDRMRNVVNAIKDFNIATTDKSAVEYDTIRTLDGADYFFARLLGLSHEDCYADYRWDKEENS